MITNNMTLPSPDRIKNILLLLAFILHVPSWAIHILYSNGTARRKNDSFKLNKSS